MISKFALLLLGIMCFVTAMSEPLQSGKEIYCYSTYHMTQSMDLAVNYGLSMNEQSNYIESDIHIREMPTLKEDIKRYERIQPSMDIRSFLFQIMSASRSNNENDAALIGRHMQPFIVYLDDHTGALIDLKTKSENKYTSREYMSYFDLFQYTDRSAELRYRNGNGYYNAKIERSANNTQIKKTNLGYIENSSSPTQLPDITSSGWEIVDSNDSADCFYKHASGSEAFDTILSGTSMVTGITQVTVALDLDRRLPSEHYFHSLSSDTSTWPELDNKQVITETEAQNRIPYLFTKLTALQDYDNEYVAALLSEKEVWPYLAEYISANGISDELGKQLFWAFDHIDSVASVEVLVQLSIAQLDRVSQFRAVMALSSTSATLSAESVDLLKQHAMDITGQSISNNENLIFVRLLGAMSNQRHTSDPLSSAEIRDFLYSQSGTYGEDVNSAILSSIGNLRNSIDERGEQVLLQSINSASLTIRDAAVSALTRTPYRSEYSDQYVQQLNVESNNEIRRTWIEVLGQASKKDVDIKKELLSMVNDDTVSRISLRSLKHIDYDLDDVDVSMLRVALKKEDDRVNQKLLASLILRNKLR